MMDNNSSSSDWIVITDFDGTLTEKDVGNELCKLFAADKFNELHKKFRAGEINLKDYQKEMWTGFPCSEKEFIECSKRIGSLRPGVNEFLEYCLDKSIPVYVASCGIEQYIHSVIDSFFSGFSKSAIKGTRCNRAQFEGSILKTLIAPESNDPTLPLHKGKWAQELSQKHGGAKTLCIGNGTSDRSFINHCDKIAAADSFYKYCVENYHKCIKFDSFFDLLKNSSLFK